MACLDDILATVRAGDAEHLGLLAVMEPALLRLEAPAAAVCGHPMALSGIIAREPEAAIRPAGAEGWPPLMWLARSPLCRTDEEREALIACADLLLEAGADPAEPAAVAREIAGNETLAERLECAAA